jgi:adhesin transport system membrane fusion protein
MSANRDIQPAAPMRLANRRRMRSELRGSRILLWVCGIALAVFVGWASQARLDQITRAPAQVIASSRTQIVQSADGGVLQNLLVREGDLVKRGQLLVSFERAKAEGAYMETRAKAAAMEANVARLRAEVFGGEPRFPDIIDAYPQFRSNQLALLSKRRTAIREEMSALQKMRALAQRELSMTEPLLAAGDVSVAEVIKLQRMVTDTTAQMANRQNKYLQDTQAEMSRAEEELASLQQALAQRRDQLQNTELFAPADGVVKNVRLTTLGGVVRAGDEVMQIVPGGDELVFEAKVPPADVGFLRVGLPTSVKVDAFDYTVFGSLQGELAFVSADTFSDDRQGDKTYYRVRVRTLSAEFPGRKGQKLDIQPGMTATVEFKTGQSTVLRYLTKPVIKTVAEALTER